jgi:tight adherence protein C
MFNHLIPFLSGTIAEVVILSLTMFATGCFVYYVLKLSLQAQHVILADGRQLERSIHILIRLVLPFAKSSPDFFKNNYLKAYIEKIDRDVISAGFEHLISGRELFMTQILLMSGGLVFGGVLSVCFKISWVWIFLISVVLFAFPFYWLTIMKIKRQKIIQRNLPFVLDLLTLSVEAGLDFMSALSKITERRKLDALSEELLQVFHSIRLGRTRRQALQEMRNRVNLYHLTVVINALVQADELGVSLGSILRIQSDEMRVKRFQLVEVLANKAPIKLLFPLIFFIFPAVFVILLGPVIFQLLQRTF